MGDYMVFTNTEVKKITKHATIRWLSLGRSLDSVTMACFRIWFQSECEDNDETKDLDKLIGKFVWSENLRNQ